MLKVGGDSLTEGEDEDSSFLSGLGRSRRRSRCHRRRAPSQPNDSMVRAVKPTPKKTRGRSIRPPRKPTVTTARAGGAGGASADDGGPRSNHR
ncbi:unnamed protein product [Lampetra planeri]